MLVKMASKFPQGSGFSNFHENLWKKTPPKKRLERNKSTASQWVPCLGNAWFSDQRQIHLVRKYLAWQLWVSKIWSASFHYVTFATKKNQKSLLQDSKALKGWLKYQYSLSILYCSMFLVTRSECVTTSFDYFPGCKKKTENQPQNSFFCACFVFPNSRRSNLG